MKERIILALCLSCFLGFNQGCQIGGNISLGPVPQQLFINDTFRDNIISEATTNIVGITSINYGGALAGGPYLDITHVDSQFVVRPSSAFEQYEENEVAMFISVTVTFSCTGGSTSPLILVVNIQDTNNNDPLFRPSNDFEFVVAPPLPPGFLVTGCFNDITVRDIDLTTSRIIFEIEDNPYFEIEYDAVASAAAPSKEFKAVLRTSTFIRTLREPVTLTMTATDVDATGDPSRTTSGIIRITADTEFEFPEEPVFTQTFYIAHYTVDHQLILQETISLQQGFDANVNFTLDGEHRSYFTLTPTGNQASLIVNTHLPVEVLAENQIYLIVRADREHTSGASATIVIYLPEETPLLFANTLYEGAIVDGYLQLSPLVLTQGYEDATVTAEILGEHSTRFTAIVQGNQVTLSLAPIADSFIDDNSFLSIQVVASNDRSAATTIVSLEIIKDDNTTPMFDKSIYAGSYDPDNGLNIEPIIFVQGFDETVSVELVGEHESFFQIIEPGPTVNVSSSTLPPEIFAERQITLSIEATKQRTVGANAVIIIDLPSARQLEFGMHTYRGTILDNELSIQNISLTVGYDQNVQFNLSGDYSTFFGVTNAQNQVTVTLPGSLPDSVITQNSAIMLTLTATGLNALSATTSILLEIIKDDTTTPMFSQNIYHGVYNSVLDFEIDDIFLSQGFDDEVSFRLDDSAHAQYFTVSNVGSNVTIALRSTIPEDVIFEEKVLLFSILADKALTVGSNSAVLIRFPAELIEATVMRFTKPSYVGTFEQNNITVESIILETGYSSGTEFLLLGEYAHHFQISNTNSEVQISNNITNTLPSDIDNDFIILTVEAQRDGAVSAWASVVIEIVKEDIIYPVFNQAFYRGSYTEENKLQFEENIYLAAGYNDNVTFHLQGDYATWFSVSQTGNSVSLLLDSDIPPGILQANNQLLFPIIALNTNGASGRAVISIDLPKDSDIRFSQEYYKGYIENDLLTLDAVTLEDSSISIDIIPKLTGDYSDYFQVINVNGSLILEIQNPIPAETLNDKRLLILTLSIPNGIRDISTVIVLEVVHTEKLPLEFASVYYVGSYNETQGLMFDNEIRIIDGDFASVDFELEGNDAIWFSLVRGENSVQLNLTEVIPPSVIRNNQHLIFTIRAEGSASTVRATIVISLHTGLIEGLVLGFDRVSYLGSINNNQSTIETITLREGYDIPGVELTLHGDLSGFFDASRQGASVTVSLETPIPEYLIPANGIILLGIQARAPEAIPAYATLVFGYAVENNVTSVELVFARTYYTGTYAPSPGLTFVTPILLAEGYDADVQFALEGDDAGWFELEGTGNSRLLVLSSPIPTGVLANNQQLVFVVNAQRTGSTTARATIVISLEPQFTEGLVLGFDRVSYLGSIENNIPTIEPITLREGYDLPGLELQLLGELSSHFSATRQGTAVTVTLEVPIPEQLVPANGIILLGIQATAPEAIPAYATLVLGYTVGNNVASVELVFARTYYTGTYAPSPGLTFVTPILLAEGYDADVQFALEGDDAGWFELEGTGNSRLLVLSSPIPTGVLANNQQLVFVVNAQRTGSTTARATIVISLEPEFTEGLVLGFDRVSYLGSIENNIPTIEPITLREGYDLPGLELQLLGELSSHFSATRQGTAVTVTLEVPIPEQLVPANGIILLGIQATAPEAIPAYATLVLGYAVEDNVASVELVFARTYYTGTYAPSPGLTFVTPILLAEGYDADVQFALEGDDAVWFELEGTGNSQLLVLSSPIPTGVLANNQQLVFVVNAQRTGSTTARATIVISLEPEFTEGLVLGFDRVSYLGSIENNIPTFEPITLREGYDLPGLELQLLGELSSHFSATRQGTAVTVTLEIPIPEQLVPANGIILLGIQATAPEAIPAFATLVLGYAVENNVASVELVFARTYYTGTYAPSPGLTFVTPILLAEGYDADVQFALEGDDAGWFELEGTGNSRLLVLSSPIPTGVLANNQQLVFVVNAQRTGSTTARATIVISLEPQFTEGLVLGFDRVSYLGSIENNIPTIEPITLREGYDLPGLELQLLGELSSHFNATRQGTAVTVTLEVPIPEQLVPANGIILLGIQATAPEAIPAYATLVLGYTVENNVASVELVFARTYYTGTYAPSPGLTFVTPILLAEGYDADVQFALEGDDAGWFELEGTGNSRLLVLSSPIPTGVLANNQQLVFVVNAQRTGSTTARATIVISLEPEFTEGLVLGFDRVSYLGSIENSIPTIEPITLREGYDLPGLELQLLGELSSHFSATRQGTAVTVTLEVPIPEQLVPANGIILLGIQATAPEAIPAYATLVLGYAVENNVASVELVFARTYYTGTYAPSPGLTFVTPISLAVGYDADVQFALEGDNAEWFELDGTGNSQQLALHSPIPIEVLASNQQLVFVVTALRTGSTTARAAIIISLVIDSQIEPDVYFEKAIFEGIIQNGVVSHEPIRVFGFTGGVIELVGELSSLFEAGVTNGLVTVSATEPLSLPQGTTHVALELQAGTAKSVLLFNVIQNDDPATTPVVTFSATSYAIRVEVTDTGLVGQVQAEADNGEAVRYSLQLTSEHLQQRLSVNGLGEIHLSAPANSGRYTFLVVATTVFTQASETATIHLSVEAVTVCGEDIVMPPLIVLDRDEEEPHFNLVNAYEGCHFSLSNRWPEEQTWLYVNETGLHTSPIDREHESIAFMALSQVQVEITLHCDTDATRIKRSLNSQALALSDFGTSKWVLTDTILFNSRRSLVNLIVTDINDNAPVFVGKDLEPIAVGYPVPELEEIVLPRSLAELQATDADIGENAELLYWSSESVLAVAPTTGFVHVRHTAILEHGSRLTVNATDRNGQGLTGSIDIVVRLLDQSNILVVTVRDTFLHDEKNVLSRLSESVGYEIKVLRSVVISNGEIDKRIKRETANTGASLQLYVYGLIEREPVAVEQLTADINAAIVEVNIASTISLEDHLAAQEICVIPGRDTGLLVATIVLSVLLFIIIVLIAVWFFLRWRRKNYNQFSDANSLASRNESIEENSKPVEVSTKPRLNIEELKKSERRLREILEGPVDDVPVQPTTTGNDAILDMPLPADSNTPIVIQSIDKLKDAADDSSDDEFGERKRPTRKSVVTFNENVEKIIHVEDTDPEDISTSPGYEIYKL